MSILRGSHFAGRLGWQAGIKKIIGTTYRFELKMESLSDKLKSLGIVPAKTIPAPESKPRYPTLESLIPGVELSNGFGSFYLSRNEYPLGYRHGIVSFTDNLSLIHISE